MHSHENDAWNSSKSFSVTSLRFPRGTVGVTGPSYSTKVEIEDDGCINIENVYLYISYNSICNSTPYFSRSLSLKCCNARDNAATVAGVVGDENV